MSKETEVITGRLPLGQWAKVCRKYGVHGTTKSEQLRNLMMKLLLTKPNEKKYVAHKTVSQSAFTHKHSRPQYSTLHPQKKISANPDESVFCHKTTGFILIDSCFQIAEDRECYCNYWREYVRPRYKQYYDQKGIT